MVTAVNEDRMILKIYNSFDIKSVLEYTSPQMKTIKITKIQFYDKDNNSREKVNHNDYVEAIMYNENSEIIKASVYDIIRMEYEF